MVYCMYVALLLTAITKGLPALHEDGRRVMGDG